MKTLIELAVALTIAAFAAGNLPKIVKSVKKAQLYILKESSSSNWGKPWVPD